MGAKVTFVGFDNADKHGLLSLLGRMDQPAESQEVAVDGLAVEVEQQGRFARFDVDAIALGDFFNAIAAQPAVSEHLFRLSA